MNRRDLPDENEPKHDFVRTGFSIYVIRIILEKLATTILRNIRHNRETRLFDSGNFHVMEYRLSNKSNNRKNCTSFVVPVL